MNVYRRALWLDLSIEERICAIINLVLLFVFVRGITSDYKAIYVQSNENGIQFTFIDFSRIHRDLIWSNTNFSPDEKILYNNSYLNLLFSTMLSEFRFVEYDLKLT